MVESVNYQNKRQLCMKNPGVPMLSETPVTLFSRPLQTPRGIQWGPQPPWSSGRESRGNRLEIGSLWRFSFPHFFFR